MKNPTIFKYDIDVWLVVGLLLNASREFSKLLIVDLTSLVEVCSVKNCGACIK